MLRLGGQKLVRLGRGVLVLLYFGGRRGWGIFLLGREKVWKKPSKK